MRPYAPILLIAASSLFFAACSGDGSNDSDWLRVLSHKRAAAAAKATVSDKQVYADSVAAFVQRNPQHSRAREVYTRIQLDFARDLALIGRHRDSIGFYRSVLANDPSNAEAASGLRAAMEHLEISREKLLALQKGMSQHDVAKLLGKPIPGWTIRTAHADSVVESWYYRRSDGTIAAVHFRGGNLLAAEENSQAKVVSLIAAK